MKGKRGLELIIVMILLVILIVSFTGYAYSRYRFKGKKASLMTVMLIQTIPTFAGITAYFTMYSIASDIMPGLTRQMMLILIYAGGGIAGNTIMTSSNINNNIKAGGTKYSETFMFNPTENLKSRRFYDRAIKLWERNSKDESEV